MLSPDGIVKSTSKRSPVQKIPSELLITIFKYWVIHRDQINTHHDLPSPLVLGQVCRKWRHLVLNTSPLWTRIDLYPFTWWPNAILDNIRAIQEALGTRTRITYHFFDSNSPFWGDQARMCHFNRRLDPIYSSHRFLNPSPEAILKGLTSVCFQLTQRQSCDLYATLPMTSANKVTISGHYGYSGSNVKILIDNLPALKDLTLENIPTSHLDKLTTRELARLRVHSPFIRPSSILPLLSTSLRVLDIWCTDSSTTGLSGVILHFPQLLELAITPFEHALIAQMKMPKLKRLTLYSGQNPNIRSPVHMLDISLTILNSLVTALGSHLEKVETLSFLYWQGYLLEMDCVYMLGRLVGTSPALIQVHFDRCGVDGHALVCTLEDIGQERKSLNELTLSFCTKLTRVDCDALASRVTKLNVYM